MRPSPKDIAVLVIAALLLVIAARLLDGGREPSEAVPPILSSGAASGETGTARELRRCRDLGEAALDDPACLDEWDANRRSFFGLPNPESGERTEPADRTAPGETRRAPHPGADIDPDTAPPSGREE